MLDLTDMLIEEAVSVLVGETKTLSIFSDILLENLLSVCTIPIIDYAIIRV